MTSIKLPTFDEGSESDNDQTTEKSAPAQMEFEDEEQLATVTLVDDFSRDDIVALSRPQPLPSVADGHSTESSVARNRKAVEDAKQRTKVKEKIKYRAPKFVPKAKKSSRSNKSKPRAIEEPGQRQGKGDRRGGRRGGRGGRK